MNKELYSKPKFDIEEYKSVDVITTSTNDEESDLHDSDDYNYGN